MDSPIKPKILTLAALRDPSRYTLVPHVPMLDVHEHINDEKPEVDAKLLELIARNTNERIRNLAIPAGNAGHTCDPGHGCREEDQPETIAYVVNWEVDEFNGRPCLYADVYYKNAKLDKAKELPYRSVERYISDRPERNFIDAVSFQKSAPERDLGVLEFYARSMEPGDTIVRYGRDMPAIRFPGGCGAKSGDCGCGCKPRGEPKAAKPARKNKGQFKKGNQHHKRRRDRRLNEGVQVNLEHLKESILGLLKKSKTGTIKARYSLDDPTATRTTSTAGPAFNVHQAAKSTFGKIPGATVVGPKPAPQPAAPGGMQVSNPLAPTNVGANPGATPRPKPQPKPQEPAANPTQAMPGQAQQQPQAPQAQPQQPQQPAARTGPMPGAASVTKAHDEAQRQAARGETPKVISEDSWDRLPLADITWADKPAVPRSDPQSATRISRRKAAAAKIAAAPKAVGKAQAGNKPQVGAYPGQKPTTAAPMAGPPTAASRNVATPEERAQARKGLREDPEDFSPRAFAHPASKDYIRKVSFTPQETSFNRSVGSDYVNGPLKPTVFPGKKTNPAAQQPKPVPPPTVGNSDPTVEFKTQDAAGNPAKPAGKFAATKISPKRPGGPLPIGNEPGQPGSQKMQGPPATFRERLRTNRKPLPEPKLSPKPIGGKGGVFGPKPPSMPKPVIPNSVRKARIEAGDKLTGRNGSSYSVLGHTPDNGSERFVHLKHEGTGKTIKVPRARFHAALQRGEITPPDEAFARTQPKAAAKPTANPNTDKKQATGSDPNWRFGKKAEGGYDETWNNADIDPDVRAANSHSSQANHSAPTKDHSQSPYRKLDAQDWTSDKAASPYENLDTPKTKPFATIDDKGGADGSGLPPRAEQYDDSEESYNETPPAPPMDRKQAREAAWKQQYNAARQFNGGKHLNPRQRKELEGHFNRIFRDAEAQGLTNNVTPQPEPGSPFGTLPKHWHDPRLRLSVGNFLRDHGRSAMAGAMTGLAGRMTPWSFEQSHNPPHLADPSPILPRSAKIYRTLNSTVPRSGMVHQSSVSYATQALANEAHRNGAARGMGRQAGIPYNPSPRTNPQQASRPNQSPSGQQANPQADPRVRPAKVVTPEEMAAAPPKLQHFGDPMLSQVVTSLAHQRQKLTADEYRRLDANWPEIKDALGKLDEQRRAAGGATTHKETAEDLNKIMASLPQQPTATPQEPQQGVSAANPAQQPSASPLAAKRLQAALGMSQGAKADPAMASDPVVLAAVKAAHIEGREPTADDIARIHELRASTFRDTKKDPKPDDLAHAYLHGQPAAPQAEPQLAPPEPAAGPAPQPEPSQAQPEPAVKPPDHPEAFTRRVDAPGGHAVPPGPSVRQNYEPRPQGPVMSREEKKRHANDAVAALMQLGHKKHAAQHMVQAAIDEGSFRDLPELLKRAIGKPPHPPQPAPKPTAEQVAKMRRTVAASLRSRMRTA